MQYTNMPVYAKGKNSREFYTSQGDRPGSAHPQTLRVDSSQDLGVATSGSKQVSIYAAQVQCDDGSLIVSRWYLSEEEARKDILSMFARPLRDASVIKCVEGILHLN